MMWMWLLLACGGDPALEQRIAQLEARQEVLDQDRLALEARLAELESTRSTLSSPTPRPAPEPITGIRQVSELEYQIERSTLGGIDSDEYMRMGRFVPHRDEMGVMDGYRISGVRRGSLPDALGIKNGDVVHGVNGHPMDSMEGAMKAYSEATGADKMTFELTRRGARETLTIQVVDALPPE